jgi:hypothetical protein
MSHFFSEKARTWLTRLPGIWLLVAGAGITIWGLFALGIYFTSCGLNEHGNPSTNTIALIFVPLILPGLAFLLAGSTVLHRMWWWFSFICLAVLCTGAIWIGTIGASWLICASVAFLSLVMAVLMVVTKDDYF